MALLESIRDAFLPSDREPATPIVGAYWCDDCSVRIPLEQRPGSDADPRPCPDCGEPMRFEPSPDDGSCAC